jgi:hypothetical protein
MKITKIGTDVITVDEFTIKNTDEKIHVIKMMFEEPTKEKV